MEKLTIDLPKILSFKQRFDALLTGKIFIYLVEGKTVAEILDNLLDFYIISFNPHGGLNRNLESSCFTDIIDNVNTVLIHFNDKDKQTLLNNIVSNQRLVEILLEEEIDSIQTENNVTYLHLKNGTYYSTNRL